MERLSYKGLLKQTNIIYSFVEQAHDMSLWQYVDMYDVTQEYGIYKERQHVCVMLNSCVSNAHRGCVLQYSHDKVVQMYDMFNYKLWGPCDKAN